MNSNFKNSWLKDFEDFLKSSEIPSESASKHILDEVCSELHPSLYTVFFKFSLVHLISFGLVLLFCPQLGVGPVLWEAGIMQLFMVFGPIGCAMGCGGFLLGTSCFLSALVLKPEELARVKKLELIHITFFASISYALLMLFGGRNESFEFLFWISGAVMGGYLAFLLGQRLRFKLA